MVIEMRFFEKSMKIKTTYRRVFQMLNSHSVQYLTKNVKYCTVLVVWCSI
jgi:hypothetical protein